MFNQVNLVDKYLNEGADPNEYIFVPVKRNVLSLAVENSSLESVIRILQDPRTDLTLKSSEGDNEETALTGAVKFGQIDMVDKIIEVAKKQFGPTQKFIDFILDAQKNFIKVRNDKLSQFAEGDPSRIKFSDRYDRIEKSLKNALQWPETKIKDRAINVLQDEYLPDDLAKLIGDYYGSADVSKLPLLESEAQSCSDEHDLFR